MRLCPVLTYYAPRKRGLKPLTKLALLLTTSALTGWLINLIKHTL